MNQEKIGKFISKIRNEKNMTQQELGTILGITDRAISKWENGRGLPDLSLIKPLCDALEITINELLNGERIKKEEYQKKLEVTLENTLNYSNTKIKHTKKILKIITTFIILTLLTLLILFIIDINRIKQQKPVVFSTWGIVYTPKINIDIVNIENQIKEYLINESEMNPHHDNEKTFVALKTYETKEKNDTIYLYAWVLEETYYEENNKIINDSGFSIPYKFTKHYVEFHIIIFMLNF